MIKIVMLAVLTALLCSCSILTNSELKHQCSSAPYVYTNLQQPISAQTYHLSDGRRCPESN